MNINAYKHKIIARRMRKIKAANYEVKYARSFYDPTGRCIVRLYFEEGILLDSRRLEKWRKRLIADYYTVVIEKSLKKVSFYCGVENFWWKFIKCSFC